MANVQPTAVPNPPNATNLNEEPPTPITSLLRFLYTGSTSSLITVKSPPNLNDIEETLSCVIVMATARALLPISTIRKVYLSKMYVRVDEVLIALAYCAKQLHSEELRMLANNEAISLINDQADFLLFVHYYMKLSAILHNGNGHVNFAHGMCRVIEKWYEKYSPVELANMFGEHRGLYGLTHQSVIKRAHMRTKKRTLNAPANPDAANVAAAGASTEAGTVVETNSNTEVNSNISTSISGPSTSDAQASEGASSMAAQNVEATIGNTESNAPTPTDQQPVATALSSEDDREQVFQFVFCKGSIDYLQYLEDKAELGAGAQRLKHLQILKTNENVDSAVQSIRCHKFTLEQMPAHLLEKEPIWDALLPTLSSQTLLKHYHTMKDLGFLNEGSSFTRKFLDVFGNPTTFKFEQICPIHLYIQKQLYSQNIRYLGQKKAEYYEKKVMKRKVTVNGLIKERMNDMFHQALFNANPAPAKFLIVLDLRRGNAKKPVLRNKHINCYDAAFLLAYSIFVREKETLVYSFTESKDKLEPLHSIMPKNDYKLAKDVVDLQTVTRSNQCLVKPIAEATALKKKVDMFVVIVDSVARFCRQGQVPVQEFTEYRQKFNDRAKYVVINLTRPKPDLKIPQTDNMKGFFEICGFSQDTPKILNALAKHCFN